MSRIVRPFNVGYMSPGLIFCLTDFLLYCELKSDAFIIVGGSNYFNK
jgi:hypothetical protein